MQVNTVPTPELTELSRLGERLSKAKFAILVQSYPELHLDEGSHCGIGVAATRQAAQVACEVLDLVLPFASARLAQWERTLHRARRFRQMAMVFTTVATLSFLVSLSGSDHRIHWILGCIASLGSICTTIADLAKPTEGKGLLERYTQLRGFQFQAERVLLGLQRRLAAPETEWDLAVLDQLTQDAEKLAASLNELDAPLT